MGVRKAAKKETKTHEPGTADSDVGDTTKIERLFLPPVTRQAEILQGSPDEVAQSLARILKDKAGLK